MRCRFCFATFQDVRRTILPAGHLDESDALGVVDELADAGFTKINFAGVSRSSALGWASWYGAPRTGAW
jgi:hypothetical protein